MKRQRSSPDGVRDYYPNDQQSNKRTNTNVNFDSPYEFQLRSLTQQNVELSNQLAQCQQTLQQLRQKNHTLKDKLTRTHNLYKNLFAETKKMVQMCLNMPTEFRNILHVFMGFLHQAKTNDVQ